MMIIRIRTGQQKKNASSQADFGGTRRVDRPDGQTVARIGFHSLAWLVQTEDPGPAWVWEIIMSSLALSGNAMWPSDLLLCSFSPRRALITFFSFNRASYVFFLQEIQLNYLYKAVFHKAFFSLKILSRWWVLSFTALNQGLYISRK